MMICIIVVIANLYIAIVAILVVCRFTVDSFTTLSLGILHFYCFTFIVSQCKNLVVISEI